MMHKSIRLPNSSESVVKGHKSDQACTLRKLAEKKFSKDNSSHANFNPFLSLTKMVIASGKGGVGKSTLTINLAISLAYQGIRTLTIDGDFCLENLDLMMGIRSQYNLIDMFIENKPLHKSILKNVRGIDNLNLVLSGSKKIALSQMNKFFFEEFGKKVVELSQEFDLTLIDTTAGVGPQCLFFASSADIVVLVGTPEPTSIADSYSFIKNLIYQLGYKTVFFIANMVKNRQEGEQLYHHFSGIVYRFLNTKVYFAGYVIQDPSVEKSIRNTNPLLLYSPHSPASHCILSIGRQFNQLKKKGFIEDTI
jgi:flagellar biosynthesis protein FlhG